MKETRWEANPKQPYGLHDCRICAMQLSGGDLHLAFEDGFYKEDGSFVQGSISVEGVDLDFCEVLLQGSAGRMGGFRGERLAIAEFVKQYEGFRFEVIDEFYGWHRLQYAGVFLFCKEQFCPAQDSVCSQLYSVSSLAPSIFSPLTARSR